ncbi:MAG: MBL fold metallo-hydrolase [Tissierellia bacterium]|nr:MBL fold metallo-hydrolase [Tissierellia bacterium]
MFKDIVIRFIYHSCYTIEIDDRVFVFDYFQGRLPMDPQKKYIFIASHGHDDHFNEKIFEWGDFEKNTYILSSDIANLKRKDNIVYLNKDKYSMGTRKKFSCPNVHFIAPYDEFFVDDLYLKAYGSTDQGISLLVEHPYLNFYHSGDLNHWIWPEDTREERQKMQMDFSKEINAIFPKKPDIAFFPLDPRLGKYYDKGILEFVDTVKPQILFPMHFQDQVEITHRFKEEHPLTETTRFQTVEYPGQRFDIRLFIENP